MPERKVYRIGGHSLSLNIPKEICKKAKINEKSVFDVNLVDGQVTLTRLK
jgi:hypothetical protein